MFWIKVTSVVAALLFSWGVRRWHRNRRRLLSGARERYPVAARVAATAGLGVMLLCAIAAMLTSGPHHKAQRKQAIEELRAIGVSIPSHGGFADFSKTKATDEHVKLLLLIPEIVQVNLSHTQITDAAADHLVRLPLLVKITLDDTALSDAARQRIEEHRILATRRMQERLWEAEEKAKILRAWEEEQHRLTEAELEAHRKAHGVPRW